MLVSYLVSLLLSMNRSFKFEELRVYQDAIKFVDMVYELTEKWPREERYNLTDQFVRAAVSIVLNIAEGSGRTRKDFQHFISNSRGSVYECVAIISIAHTRKLINKEEYEKMYEECVRLAKMLTALKRSLK